MNGRVFSEEQKMKYDFVRTTLSALIREVTSNLHYQANYYVRGCREYVDISFDNEYNVRRVDVTACSLLQLTRDVLKTF